MTSLTECEACGRHVRRTEETCPFCAASRSLQSASVERSVGPLPTDRRLTRAAFVFASAAAVAACGKNDSQQPQPPPQPTLQAPAYGPAVVDAPDAGPPQPQAVPAYGAPPVSSQKK